MQAIQETAAGFSEIMPGATNEIYPHAGCFVQAWNSMVTMWPYADTIFGIKIKYIQYFTKIRGRLPGYGVGY